MRKKILSILLFLLCSCRDELLNVTSEIEANRILLSLRENEVDAKKTFIKGVWQINVESNHFTRALKILENKRLYYRSVVENKNDNQEDLFSTRSQKNARATEKVSRELAATLLMFPAVIDAKVHIFKKDSLDNDFPLSMESASVVLITELKNQIDHDHIKTIVSKGTGVPKESVYVVEKVASSNEKENSDSENELVEASNLNAKDASFLSKMPQESKIALSGICLLVGLLFSLSFIMRRRKFRKEIDLVTQLAD